MQPQIYKLDWYLNDQGEQTAVLPGTEITLSFDGRAHRRQIGLQPVRRRG